KKPTPTTENNPGAATLPSAPLRPPSGACVIGPAKNPPVGTYPTATTTPSQITEKISALAHHGILRPPAWPALTMGAESPTCAPAPAQIANPCITPTMGTANPITPSQ